MLRDGRSADLRFGKPGGDQCVEERQEKAAVLTLLGDALKGLFAVLLAKGLQGVLGLSDTAVGLTALAALVGHMWPLFFGFKGGKGVATALGVLLALSWPTALVCALVWLVMAFGFKVSSLAALVATVISVPAAWFLCRTGRGWR
ncbi:putative acyl-phosphate glycerol 3-phosphate acyltransferase [Neisseria elongata subsp. glycolytica ATCC 29315]|uniref:Putative acyl-phosphate glycerol 3-phosphate acyltransferase n=1 Tax=Neisseria elongata subsp. glycolytica ATCC 29315 TaxID=546263 RepID=D4DTA5_NEIEG|nr:putative acyl-phosphate glycerol 3-phosphate acyltransferase [Neisseria elongata subsp. glycolytica ATCC 29315]